MLHVSYMVHIPWYTTRILRRLGMKADHLAIGRASLVWDRYDFHHPEVGDPLAELRVFWGIVAKYEVVHCHFGLGISLDGWEFPVLKRLGRTIVAHYRGCEVRDPVLNQRLHPEVNICQACDYGGSVCRDGKPRVERIRPYADLSLVTTPDMRDFEPGALHFPFFSPEIDAARYPERPRASERGGPFKIVHTTNHPGIEGTEHIARAVDRLKARGHAVELCYLSGVPPERVLEELRDADLSVGKMKMGYYANAQIESLYLGVPAVTWVREDLRTPELEGSGLVLTDLAHLEETLEYYLTHPAALAARRAEARAGARRLHDNDRLGRFLVDAYAKARSRS